MEKKGHLTPHPEWIRTLEEFVKPYWKRILSSPCVDGAAKGNLTTEQMRGWILQLYPFIHAFPKFLAESLTRTEDDYSREFLIDGIRIEKEHATHWIWMGIGFGISKKEMLEITEGNKLILRDVQSLTDWLWHINTKGSIAEAVAATSYAIEGVTGDISDAVVQGFTHYQGRPGVRLDDKSFKWMKEHAQYDDVHPKIALEVVKKYAITPGLQTRVMVAAKRSLQLLDHALDTCFRAYFPAGGENGQSVNENRRKPEDRRKAQVEISFPDRRFREQRGSKYQIVA